MEEKFGLLKKDVVLVVLLFTIALGVRLAYQNASVVNSPIRADASEYFFTAYNLQHFGVYSSSPTFNTDTPPEIDFRRPPGYPLFLYLFISGARSLKDFVDKVTLAQAVLSSLTVVLLYILARLVLPMNWAFLSGLLTALSPHLIAVDHFILTESLFIFVIVFSVLLFTLYIRENKNVLLCLSGCYFAFAILIKPVAILLGPFVGVMYFAISKYKVKESDSRLIMISLCGYLLCIFLVYSPYFIYRNFKSSEGRISFSQQSKWTHFILGADVNLKKFIKRKIDEKEKLELGRQVKDKKYGLSVLMRDISSKPFSYVKWYLGGKLFHMWRWDNVYNGDVYQYPMIKKGFEENRFLHFIHRVMFFLHWPLYLFTLGSLVYIFIFVLRSPLSEKELMLLPSCLVIMYFALLLTVLLPLPRYMIPVRPFAYLLAAFGMRAVITFIRSKKVLTSA